MWLQERLRNLQSHHHRRLRHCLELVQISQYRIGQALLQAVKVHQLGSGQLQV